MNCMKCQKRLPRKPSGKGRPAVYCSTPCRRAAEYELRRIQASLERLEEDTLAARYSVEVDGRTSERKRLGFYESQIAEKERRLLLLLAGAGDGGE